MMKIISILMAATMLASAVPALATTEGIIQGDVMMTSEVITENPERNNRYVGTVENVDGNRVSVTIDEDTYTFVTTETTLFYTINGEKAEKAKKGDMVIVVSKSALETKDIKEAEAIVITNKDSETSVYLDTFNMDGDQLISADGELVLNIENTEEYAGKNLLVFYSVVLESLPAQTSPEKIVVIENAETSVDDNATPREVVSSYYRHEGTVSKVNENSVEIAVEGDMIVTFVTTDNTLLYTIDGNVAEKVAEGDKVIVLSASPLASKDIKEAAAIIVKNEESYVSVYLDNFDMVEDQLLSADGGLVLNIENAEKYAGKKLLVFYDMMTMSIPAQTPPIKVIEVVEANDSVSVKFNIGDSAININGQATEVEPPYIAGTGVTLVSMRVISEAFNAQVIWDGNTKSVTVNHEGKTIVVTIGSKTATVDGVKVELEAAPELTENGFTMIPLRFISENLGAEVGYIHESQTITVER